MMSAKRGERLKLSLRRLSAKSSKYLEEYPMFIAVSSNVVAPEVRVVFHLVGRRHRRAVLRDLLHVSDFVVGDADGSCEALR